MTPGQLDLVTYQEYDAAGRSSATWLPVNAASGNNGNPLSLSAVQSRSQLSSNYGDGKAYSKPVYEASPWTGYWNSTVRERSGTTTANV